MNLALTRAMANVKICKNPELEKILFHANESYN